MSKWTRDRPTKEGTYWFYGERSHSDLISMRLVTCHKCINTTVLLVSGNFMHDNAKGHFMPADVPEPPTGEEMTS